METVNVNIESIINALLIILDLLPISEVDKQLLYDNIKKEILVKYLESK